MAQEHLDAVEAAIENLVKRRRELVAALVSSITQTQTDELLRAQSALEALYRAKADEQQRMPSIQETGGIKEI
ncbi:hypothetical protein [Neorhizobium galegae]|jgi:uncharacterized protein (DUF305 family)|uniref:Uncharacterized protein n=2 Tax=Neorhizobium galegae TaxID=399 RepID=A0A068SS68_NEOGA|nr:hypothetical protein [Neorhizobium galegae]KAB1087760.1 hypothetical protein F4V91_15780 [Neorhizobium galegae]MCQ1851204.1 hypothetical protein [Neorhizobium galegae]CDN49073.1 Hypothetical protein RG540_CH29070 [Neorhizobium galegae bv. orientalis str. HAMBI 540]CDZ50561.1 Hypothetical protein NGAL_HAMBI2427_37140 [Neorhizobium galegae bv. orientalis]